MIDDHMTLCRYVFFFFFSPLPVQVDRSPTGSGVTARVAVQFHKKQIQLGQLVSRSCARTIM